MIETTVLQRVYKNINNKYPYIAKSKDTERYGIFTKPNHFLILKDDNRPKDVHWYEIGTDESFYIPFKDELIIKNK